MKAVGAMLVMVVMGIGASAGDYGGGILNVEAFRGLRTQELKWKSFAVMNSHYETEFVKAEGFGISRMPSIPAFSSCRTRSPLAWRSSGGRGGKRRPNSL